MEGILTIIEKFRDMEKIDKLMNQRNYKIKKIQGLLKVVRVNIKVKQPHGNLINNRKNKKNIEKLKEICSKG